MKIKAGCLAKKMGLPLRLISAVNENDIVARTFQTGKMDKRAEVKHTFSSAMDIQVNLLCII